MSNEVLDIRCSIVRGGTSKAIFLMNNELPADPKARESVILAVFGSPSLRQLDGLGGADITTSKVAIIGPPTRPDADIDYTFGQVSMDEHFVDFGGNCGNISAAVGESAVEAFGNLTDYSRVLCGDFPLDENTRIWFGVSPEDGFPHNYVVVRKADSLNGTLFALREVKVDG